MFPAVQPNPTLSMSKSNALPCPSPLEMELELEDGELVEPEPVEPSTAAPPSRTHPLEIKHTPQPRPGASRNFSASWSCGDHNYGTPLSKQPSDRNSRVCTGPEHVHSQSIRNKRARSSNSAIQQQKQIQAKRKAEWDRLSAYVEGTSAIRRMSDQMNAQYGKRILELHVCMASWHYHRFLDVHFDAISMGFLKNKPMDIAAVCLQLTLKSEEMVGGGYCPLEHLIDHWLRLRIADESGSSITEVNVPPEGKQQLLEYFHQLEHLVAFTGGLHFRLDLPHPLVLRTLHLIGDSLELKRASYALCSDCLLLTDFGFRESPVMIAAVSIILAAYWLDHSLDPTQICASLDRYEKIDVEKAKDYSNKLAQTHLGCHKAEANLLVRKIAEWNMGNKKNLWSVPNAISWSSAANSSGGLVLHDY